MRTLTSFMRVTVAAMWIALPSRAWAETNSFPLPAATEKTVWEAEAARWVGEWERAEHPWANGKAYLKPAGSDRVEAALEFTFQADRFTTLQVWPLWWRHGERKSASRFPHPLPPRWGPHVLDAHGVNMFFTAPQTGKVGVLNAASEKLVASIEVGGYLSDLVAHRDAGQVFVADAQGKRVVALDAKKFTKLNEITLNGRPWSLALHQGKLYAGCLVNAPGNDMGSRAASWPWWTRRAAR